MIFMEMVHDGSGNIFLSETVWSQFMNGAISTLTGYGCLKCLSAFLLF